MSSTFTVISREDWGKYGPPDFTCGKCNKGPWIKYLGDYGPGRPYYYDHDGLPHYYPPPYPAGYLLGPGLHYGCCFGYLQELIVKSKAEQEAKVIADPEAAAAKAES